MSDTDPSLPDLTICDREPITRLDRIQSFGFLLALSNDWTIARASANTAEMFGVAPDMLIGRPLDSVISRQALHDIRNRMTILQATSSERLYDIGLVNPKQRFDLSLHYSGELLVLEGEPSLPQDRMEAASMVRAMIERLKRMKALGEFHRDAARQIRAITGFERVMIYRFEDNGDGDVIVESTRSNIESFLGLRYPASDIPVQARALYLANPFRIIADVHAPTVPVLPLRGGPEQALDMTHAVTRAVSPVHIEYLTNMGVGASLSISIIVEGKLWGLIACHHGAARCPSFVMRTAAELFGHMYSMTLESRLRGDAAAAERSARELSDRMMTAIAADESLLTNAEWIRDIVGGMIPCDGVAIFQGGRVSLNGSTPPEEDVYGIARYLDTASPSRVFDTSELASIEPRCAQSADRATGMLSIPVSRTPRDYIMLFRREMLQEVRWSGDPTKAVVQTDDGLRLSPRKSFAAFASMVRGKSQPFSEADLRLGEAVRVAIIEVILRYSEAASEERRRSTERSELLIAELNHRVRNILTLVRGLITRTGQSVNGVAEYMSALNGRVQALARAHDYVTRNAWGPASLASLLEDEVNTHRRNGHDVLTVDGPPVQLHPTAMTTMALVVHELATNSAKYGALSTDGCIHVTLAMRTDGGLDVRWRERGGPAVQAPTRRGFGSVVIERTVPFDLQGTAEVRYLLGGLEADFYLPAKHLVPPQEVPSVAAADVVSPHRTVEQKAKANSPLAGAAVLLLEDSMIIALETEDMLYALGADHVTTASTIAEAVASVASSRFDLAVLDINVAGQVSFDFARRLRGTGVPFIFASGYGDQVALDGDEAGAVVLQKPFVLDHLREALLKGIDGRVDASSGPAGLPKLPG
ncbi:HWE histidine kinase domain-containing protein [Sphingomonas sp. TREG-RG-20F-R18-01]|uniref:HWE histidine kinase domain-containing protein n=1 Tax=Sphingomonas sp. TREG-RG-20F-R18-01 TaxID=2914982 RepID=UPI001F5AF5A6|nr:HWE histidine kinase domain-containing protein [Sphingomonas sp. TREG-RG-20F-R18-01]